MSSVAIVSAVWFANTSWRRDWVFAPYRQLTVTSVPGRGSTFTLHVPCAEQATVKIDAALTGGLARERV